MLISLLSISIIVLTFLITTRGTNIKENNELIFIITAGILVTVIFTSVLIYNLMPKNTESNSYFVKVNEEMSAKIESLEINNSKLNIATSGDALKYCVKSTKSTPSKNSICWKNIANNKALISIYEYKKYYIWIMDTKGQISSPMSLNTKKEG